MPSLPPCPNFLEGSCSQSEVFISKETAGEFVFACRTCKGLNIWPKSRDEKAAKYEAFLRQQADLERRRQAYERRTIYSITPAGRKS